LDLRRLAAHRGCTVRAMLERLIADEVERLIDGMTDEQFERFLSAPSCAQRVPLRRNVKARTPTSRAEALERPTRDAEPPEGGALSP
jgi:hypothetical protein